MERQGGVRYLICYHSPPVLWLGGQRVFVTVIEALVTSIIMIEGTKSHSWVVMALTVVCWVFFFW
jgi:hypothetical protein